MPTITTNAATNIDETSATLNGEITDLGIYASVDAHFEYRQVDGDGEPLIISAEQEAMVDYLIANVSSSHRGQPFSPPATVSTTNANHLLTWQMDGSGSGTWGTKGSPDHNGIGGWSKDFNDRIYSRDWDGSEQITKSWRSGTTTNENGTSTLDNDGTTVPIQFLAAVYGEYGGTAYQDSGWKAIQMIIAMQHNNGSFMESYPAMLESASSQYPNQGIINDEVHYNVMQMYRKILNNVYPFDNDFFTTAQKAEIQESYDKALDFLIQAQIQNNLGKRQMWAGNYTAETYTPGWNRHFEPPSNMGLESMMLIFMLLDHTPMTDEIKRAIYYSSLFVYENVLEDTAYRNDTVPYFYSSSGDTTWYRFYELETNTGIFAEDWTIYYDLGDLSSGQRTSYTWGTTLNLALYNTSKTYIDTNGIPAEPTGEWIATPTQTISSTGVVTENITGLDPNTEYEFKLVVNGIDGNILTFTTTTTDSVITDAIKLTIQSSKIDATLTDFPVYVDLSAMPQAFWDTLGTDTIAVYADDETTKLDRELVSIDTINKTGELWFRAPSISSTVDTIFYIKFVESEANSTNVWNNDYQAVYHLQETSSTEANHYKDSTSNARHGTGGPDATYFPEPPTQIDGTIGKGSRTNGVDEGMATANTELSGSAYAASSVRAWVRRQADSQSSRSAVFGKVRTDGNAYELGIRLNTSNYLQIENNSGGHFRYVQSSNILNNNTWVLVHGRFSAPGTLQIFENGVYIGESPSYNEGITVSNTPIGIGGIMAFTVNDTNRRFNGDVDEARLALTSWTDAWIKAEYENEANFATFMSIEYESAIGVPILTVAQEVQNIKLTWTYPE